MSIVNLKNVSRHGYKIVLSFLRAKPRGTFVVGNINGPHLYLRILASNKESYRKKQVFDYNTKR